MTISTHFCNLVKAYRLMRELSFQSHSGHWDPQRTGGQNCPECIRIRKLRLEADKMAEDALEFAREICDASFNNRNDTK